MTHSLAAQKTSDVIAFIIKSFQTIVIIFIVISTADMSSGLLQVFVELGNLHGTSNYALY